MQGYINFFKFLDLKLNIPTYPLLNNFMLTSSQKMNFLTFTVVDFTSFKELINCSFFLFFTVDECYDPIDPMLSFSFYGESIIYLDVATIVDDTIL
jgi:hypothetical protein